MSTSVLINETRILREVWISPGISRIGLARSLGLSKSAVTKIVGGFLEERLLVLAETPDVTNCKGRRPTGLYLNGDLGVVLGIEIQTDRWFAVAHDLQGNRVDTLDPQPIRPEADVMDAITDAIAVSRDRQRAHGRRTLGVGIGLSGLVDPYEGIILSSNPLGIRTPLNVAFPLQAAHGIPLVIENDANCCSWKTMLERGSERDRNFISLLGELRPTRHAPADGFSEMMGVAVGLGIVIKDSVLHGNGFSAGEFQSVFKRIDSPTQFNIPLDRLPDLRRDKRLWRKLMTELARNLSLLVNVLNMTSVIIFGDFARYSDPLVDLLHEEIQSNWLYDSEVRCAVLVDNDTTHAVASGAAAFLLHRIFWRPDVWDGAQSEYPEGIDLLRTAVAASR
jgi:predicted NBD/HSP70 family sugar kinase